MGDFISITRIDNDLNVYVTLKNDNQAIAYSVNSNPIIINLDFDIGKLSIYSGTGAI